MPFPHWVARLNKRFTNRLVEPVVSRSRHYGHVVTVGRRTGHTRRTPLFVFASGSTRWIALTYGPRADWVRNVLAGGGTLHWQDDHARITDPRVVDRADAWPHVPRWVRFFLRALRVRDVLRFEVEAPGKGSRATG